MNEIDSDLISKLNDLERVNGEISLRCISPDDAKYSEASKKLSDYLSADAKWKARL